jgi:uncharacterized membrane protein YkgB
VSTFTNTRTFGWSAAHAFDVLRIGFGILFLWLGLLKLVPGVSPAEPLMKAAMPAIVPIDLFIRFAAVWEILIGLGFLSGLLPRLTLLMTAATMVTTLSILLLAPTLVWRHFPIVLTFEGEYVVKDLIIASSALVLVASLPRALGAAERRMLARLMPHAPSAVYGWYAARRDSASAWFARYSVIVLRIAFAAVFFVFGAVKLVPGTSALEPLTHALVPVEPFGALYAALGVLEMLIALALVVRRLQRLAGFLAIGFLLTTLASLLMRPDLMFQHFPVVLTLEGQHMLKNVILLGAALVLLDCAEGPSRARRLRSVQRVANPVFARAYQFLD